MNLFLNKILSCMPAQITPPHKSERGYSTALQGPSKDCFVKTDASCATSFLGKSKGAKTKAGDCLKELDNITCPYSGVKMISGSKMDRLEVKLEHCNNIHERLDILEKHKQCMQKLEKTMFNIFKGYAINNPNGSLNECLQEMKPESLAMLRIEELKVLDAIDKISNKIEPKTALEIRRVTTNARKIILEDKQDQIFKRKDILTSLYNITKDYPNQEIVAEMWTTANKLPKSTTNIDAFVVKYANRDPHEIAARLLRPSVASIEHITPKSIKPDHTLANFMLASRDWNSDRSSTPLAEYIEEHPNIPRNCQRYADDIIRSIHHGRLQDCHWYPYMLKEKLYNESDGIIFISLSKYNIPEGEAFIDAPDDVVKKYNDLKAKREARQTNTATNE